MFKDIEGYEGKYSIGDNGEVYSTPSDGKPSRLLKQEVMKRSHTNYRRVSLSKDGKVSRFSVHRLVAYAFIDNPDGKPMVNHLDNNGENNSVDNIEWCTHSENMLHAHKQGRLPHTYVAGSDSQKITTEKAMKASTEKAKDMVGMVFGDFKIIGYAGRKFKYQRHYATVECKCGKIQDSCIENLKNGSVSRCRSCGSKEMHERRRSNVS